VTRGLGEHLGHPLSDGRHLRGPPGESLGQVVGEGRSHPAGSLGCLVEVGEPKPAPFEEIECPGVDHRPHGLHDVAGQGVPPRSVGVQDAQGRVEPNEETGQSRLGLEEGVQVVEDGVGGVGGSPRALPRDGRDALAEGEPVFGEPRHVGAPEVHRYVRPGGPVGVGGGDLGEEELIEGTRQLEVVLEDPLNLRPGLLAPAQGDQDSPAYGIRVGDPELVEEGVVAVQSYGEYFEAYRHHPEAKALGPDGEPCRSWTQGLLGPRTVRATRHVRIGKESNRLSDDDLVIGTDDLAIEYGGPRVCGECGAPLRDRQRMWCGDACRKRRERRDHRARQLLAANGE
jgi:hypothetical protein